MGCQLPLMSRDFMFRNKTENGMKPFEAKIAACRNSGDIDTELTVSKDAARFALKQGNHPEVKRFANIACEAYRKKINLLADYKSSVVVSSLIGKTITEATTFSHMYGMALWTEQFVELKLYNCEKEVSDYLDEGNNYSAAGSAKRAADIASKYGMGTKSKVYLSSALKYYDNFISSKVSSKEYDYMLVRGAHLRADVAARLVDKRYYEYMNTALGYAKKAISIANENRDHILLAEVSVEAAKISRSLGLGEKYERFMSVALVQYMKGSESLIRSGKNFMAAQLLDDAADTARELGKIDTSKSMLSLSAECYGREYGEAALRGDIYQAAISARNAAMAYLRLDERDNYCRMLGNSFNSYEECVRSDSSPDASGELLIVASTAAKEIALMLHDSGKVKEMDEVVRSALSLLRTK